MEDMNESFISSKTANKIVHILPPASKAARAGLDFLDIPRFRRLVMRSGVKRSGEGAEPHQGGCGETVRVAGLGKFARSKPA